MNIVIRPNYFVRLFDSISQVLNVALLNGDANESISGRSYRENWNSTKIIDSLIFWDDEHCKTAYYSDLARAKTLVYERENNEN